MAQTIKVAGVQMDVAFANTAKNLNRIEEGLRKAAAQQAKLVVFPECAVTGYCYETLAEAMPLAESVPGPVTERLATLCHELKVFAVTGMLERDGDRLFNACVLTGPDGLVAGYRKIHLPFLGIDCFATPGDRPFAVHEAAGVQVGMHICYDSAFPESARTMALSGAELLVLPTNFPPAAECLADHVIPARAMENGVYVMSVNRVGEERGFRFIGHSKICDADGRILAAADHTEEAILYADIDPSRARNKHRVRVPNKHEIHRFRDRRPELYGKIVESPPAGIEG